MIHIYFSIGSKVHSYISFPDVTVHGSVGFSDTFGAQFKLYIALQFDQVFPSELYTVCMYLCTYER